MADINWAQVGLFQFAFLFSLAVTFLLLKWAERLGLIDVPNHRSSHKAPTPRGGGFAFVVTYMVSLAVLYLSGDLSEGWVVPLMIGGLAVGAVGFLDDLKSLSARWRLLAHFVVAILTFLLLTKGMLIPVHISLFPEAARWFIAVFCVLYIAWMINLYNFMDGIDGLAATQGVVVAGLSSALALYQGNMPLFLLYGLLSAAVLGFLLFNWSPAKIFMGDCGAYFLGFAFATLALMAKIYSAQSFVAHLIILGVFIVDATYTLVVRAVQGKKLYVGHRDHGFQHAVQKGLSHRRVVVLLNLITIFWLAPWALVSLQFTDWSWTVLIVAYAPLIALMVWLQAGRDWVVQEDAAPSAPVTGKNYSWASSGEVALSSIDSQLPNS